MIAVGKKHRISSISIATLGFVIIAVILTSEEARNRQKRNRMRLKTDPLLRYLIALRTYAKSVEEKAQSLENCLKEGRTDDYVLIAHSLKSMSKSIGALGLSEQAKELELAGREGKTEQLHRDTRKFIREYRELGNRLQTIMKEG